MGGAGPAATPEATPRVFSGTSWVRELAARSEVARLGGGGGDRGAGVQAKPADLIFVSGDRSQVGKSSTCLGLLATLHEKLGYAAHELAYIKPATQCEAVQLVTRYALKHGIEAPTGPVTYVSGFTREFLAGNTKTSEEMLQDIEEAVGALRRTPGRRLVVVDGVGYPAVGSIVGLSNAAMARRIGAPVVLVCPSGVGNAIDSYNLNATFFEAHGVKVLGALFNRFSREGFYAVDKAEPSIRAYFAQFKQTQKVYACLTELEELKELAKAEDDGVTWGSAQAKAVQALLGSIPADGVQAIIQDAAASITSGPEPQAPPPILQQNAQTDGSVIVPKMPARTSVKRKLTQAEIIRRAKENGAKRSG
ncbi:Hypothetical Protein FCC1311_056452 [Hondaea fermentalgiana]|uniref:Uncharacterized protein n=1 Tax=Hondaea fermentalgiana TaxID=2315210 RepID=A0A2R5GNH5_9STRA|nr:Hypothetical Protein FCC1311_056452 [Hondaea fermentalgiana]|eukprot:GBG29424.1 Hypothetical Protein FCC1311_056452 [Hondaea fermentalgiana]